MKNKFLSSILFIFVLLIGLFSCSKEDEKLENVSTQVNLTVEKEEQPVADVDVYLFKKLDQGVTSFDPFFADKNVTTGTEGIAVFELNGDFDLSLNSSETTLYFIVFDEAENVLGKTELTINKGETKDATLSY
ncbi:hypothetical protein [Flammeovirga sp. SJP92]|uniref:hypothetical protein n=1 Tax=Flammeovirga sp. SJP92 TaxID=1775430 RepID=UPI0007893252|nr:hypothetical protein [Flammeovirga sp. SJP92]KXX70495.1 hypothetical protein AVL50_08340 [Flammeovirga sp. SJP92]